MKSATPCFIIPGHLELSVISYPIDKSRGLKQRCSEVLGSHCVAEVPSVVASGVVSPMSDAILTGIIAKECLRIAAQLFLIFPRINPGACILFFFGEEETRLWVSPSDASVGLFLRFSKKWCRIKII